MTNDPNGRLHLSSLSIRGFRGIKALDIPRLGRVTLLAGKNGVGKTAVLESVQVYASRGRLYVLSALLRRHEEFAPMIDEDDRRRSEAIPTALFHGRDISLNSRIEIGPKGGSNGDCLKIEAVAPNAGQLNLREKVYRGTELDSDPTVIEISFANTKRRIPWLFSGDVHVETSRNFADLRLFRDNQEELARELICRSLGPGLLGNAAVAKFWDDVALTDDEDRAVDALNLVLDDKVDRVTMIGDDQKSAYGRRAVVKLRNGDKPAPLRSLGDGAARLFSVALALAGSRNGFLIIDEAENGIHHSVHDDFWRMILQTATQNNVQILATTHSFDCVRGFANAAAASPECEGVLVRLEQDDEKTRAVVYSDSELRIAAEQGIEVR